MSTNRLCGIRANHIVVLAVFTFAPSFCSGQALALIQSGIRHAATSNPGRNSDFGPALVIHRNTSTSIVGTCITCATPVQAISLSLTARPSLNHLQP